MHTSSDHSDSSMRLLVIVSSFVIHEEGRFLFSSPRLSELQIDSTVWPWHGHVVLGVYPKSD